MKTIKISGLVLMLFFCEVQINDTFARTTTQYQLYRLSDDPSDDRRPKLAINDQGTVWVVWESDRDGDFDIYGKRFENSGWSDLIEVAQDTNVTLICDVLFNGKNRLFIFGTETDLAKNPFSDYHFDKRQLFFLSFSEDSTNRKQILADVQHTNPYWNKHPFYPDDLPKAISFDQNLFVSYVRKSTWYYGCDDSLFLRSYEEESWHTEYCDTIFQDYDGGILQEWHYTFPIFNINLIDRGLFVIYYWYDRHGSGPLIENIGLILGNDHIPRYIKLTRFIEDFYDGRIGLQAYSYGSNLRSIFLSGFYYKEKKSFEKTQLIKQIELINDTLALDKRQWLLDFEENIKISQMSDLVAFVWSDSANIYVKTFQDSIWYETLELPLNGLTHIDHSINCAVYNNQHIWIAFDAIYNGNKDVYALSIPASFVVDTVMTSVRQGRENKTPPNEFALFQNYPNPFNSITTIKYQLPEATEVKLEIYNLLGQRIRTLVDQSQLPGSYSINWDGMDDFSQSVSSGVYLYQLKNRNYITTKKLVMLQ